MNNYLTINIAVIGAVSCGKSTFINSILSNYVSEMTRKRNTMIPQIYKESNDNSKVNKSFEEIEKENKNINNDILNKNNNELFDKKEYYIPKITNLVSLPDNINYKLIDLPGVNDSGINNNEQAIILKWPCFMWNKLGKSNLRCPS